MTEQEIREFISGRAKAIFEMRMRYHGMTEDVARDDANAYIQGAVEAFRVMGELTKRDAVKIYSDLFLIR